MEQLRKSLQAIDLRGIISNVVNFVTGDANGDNYSSEEEVSCNSDCSLCRSDAISISSNGSIKEERMPFKCYHQKVKRIKSNYEHSQNGDEFIKNEKRTSEPTKKEERIQ